MVLQHQVSVKLLFPLELRGNVRVVGCDAKDFTRDKVLRDADGNVIERKAREGFITHLATAVEVRDIRVFGRKIEEAFDEAATSFRLELNTRFASSQSIRQRFFPDFDDRRTFVAMLFKVLEGVQDEIARVRFTWLRMDPNRYPEVNIRAGRQPVMKAYRAFHSTVANMASMLAAADYAFRHPNGQTFAIDSFQGRPNFAWKDLSQSQHPFTVYPWGDEVHPVIAAADVMGMLTDVQLSASYQKLNQEALQRTWAGRPFEVEGYFFGHKQLPWLKWHADASINTARHHPRPMIYLDVDNQFLGDVGDRQAIRFKDVAARKGFYDVPIVEAQHRQTAAKLFSPVEDSGAMRDGDLLVTLGTEAARRAANLATYKDIRVMDIKSLRQHQRDAGYAKE